MFGSLKGGFMLHLKSYQCCWVSMLMPVKYSPVWPGFRPTLVLKFCVST